MNEESIVILPPLLVRETLLPATRTTSVDPDPDPPAVNLITLSVAGLAPSSVLSV